MHRIRILPEDRILEAASGANLLTVLRDAGLAPEAPCGGQGKCGKCRVRLEGREVLSCLTQVDRDMTLWLPRTGGHVLLTDGLEGTWTMNPLAKGYLLAFDIGTTTVAGYLLEPEKGKQVAGESKMNPQAPWGADVITRIRHAIAGGEEKLTQAIRGCLRELTETLCGRAGIGFQDIGVVSVVGNPAMQQLFLGISPENLARIPFDAVLKAPKAEPAGAVLPEWGNALLLTVPDISGFVGADTVACVLACEMDRQEEITLLVDIGTNAEMVLGNREKMIACAAAAGPALEGANIRFGMGAREGAIDHGWIEDGRICCSVIGGGEAKGICGSGLVDVLAAALDLGWINTRGKVLREEGILPLADGVYLTREDVEQVQLAKGAIAAGIRLMADRVGVALQDIDRVCLAGAFGTFLNPESACRIGLLPRELQGKIRAIGNGAGAGAKQIAMDRAALERTGVLAGTIEFLELASLPEFPRCFAAGMRF